MKAPFLELSELVEKEFGPLILFRPNRDTRFSKDKTPYKTAAAARDRERRWRVVLRADLGGGSLRRQRLLPPANDQLERFRRAVADNRSGPKFVSALETVRKKKYSVDSRDSLKRVPRGFDPDHPRAELLQHKGIHCGRDFGAPKWLHSNAAHERIVTAWRDAKPVNTWLDTYVGPSAEAPPEP